MEEQNNVVKRNSKGIVFFLMIIAVIAGVCVGFVLSKNSKKEQPKEELKEVEISIEDSYEGEYKTLSKFLINNKDVLPSMIEIAHYTELKLIDKSVNNQMVFANIDMHGTQFNNNILFIYDKNGELIDYFYRLENEDYDNNIYKYNGVYSYDNSNNILTFNTTLWLGEGDESTGKGFDDKSISELSKNELETFGNYAYEVKYEYKYENGKFKCTKKEPVSLLKNNEYFSYLFK